MKSKKSILDKLTALWALNESGLGGFLHVFNSPFTGFIVGGMSILLISLIAYYAENKWQAILKALIIVLIIKMAVSPYSPFAAYIAVSFQAIFGAFLLSNFSWKGATLMVLGLVTFLESAFQKLIVLTVVYGENLWEAIDIYGYWVQDKMNFISQASPTNLLVGIYLVVYGVAGILAGFFIRNILQIISSGNEFTFQLEINTETSQPTQKRKSFKTKIIWVWLITVAIIVLAFTIFGGPLFGWEKAIYIVLRSFLILMIWYVIVGPLLLKIIRNYLNRKESEYKRDISNAMDLFPYFRQIITYTWKESKKLKGYKRFEFFIAKSISNCIHFES
ncbi:MAG: hypothetical protein ACSHXF_00270 [Aquaticitalea sp.]